MAFIDKIKVGGTEYGISPIVGSGLTKNEESGAINVNVSSGLTIIDNQICIDASFDNDIRDGLKVGFKTLKRVNSYGETLTYFDTMEQIIAVLDTMTGTTVSDAGHYEGNFRAFIGGPNVDSFVEIKSKVLGWTSNVWMQEIKTDKYLRLVRNETDDPKLTNVDKDLYYRYAKYTQTFESPTQSTGEFNIYTRIHKNDEWGRWCRKNGPYSNNPLEGKNVLILGGSFAHNWKGYSVDKGYNSLSGMNFNDEYGVETSMMDYVANKLNLSGFGNFAQAANGICKRTFISGGTEMPLFQAHSVRQITDATSYALNTLERGNAAYVIRDDNGTAIETVMIGNKWNTTFKWDAVIVLCGINDYAKQKESDFNESDLLGTPGDSLRLDPSGATYYSSLKEICYIAETKNAFIENVQIYFISPYKAIQAPYQNPFVEATPKEGKHTYLEFLEAFKNVSTINSLPYLDLYSKCGINTNNYNHYTRNTASDPVHPNGYGYFLSSNIILNFLMQEGTKLKFPTNLHLI